MDGLSLAQPWARLALPRLSDATARRSSSLAEATGIISSVLGKSPVQFRILPLTAPARCDWCISVGIDNESLSLFCTHQFLAAALRALEPSLALEPAPPASLMALLIDALLSPTVFAPLRKAGRMFTFVDLHPANAPSPGGPLVQANLAGNTFQLTLSGPAAVDRILLDWPRTLRDVSKLALRSWLWLGSTELPITVVGTIEVGDAIRVHTRPSSGFSFRLSDTWGGPAQQRGDNLILLKEPGPHPDTTTGSTMPTGDNTALGSLPVRIDFTVGHKDIALAELQALRAGSILATGRAAFELVEISVNGRRIGTGELIDVEGAVAVRITKLFGFD
jgi:type III secretion system YscQ/HrcQ family protein